MTESKILNIFKKSGALLTGHFLLTSGRHSDRYFQCAKVLQYPEYTEVLCKMIADNFRKFDIDTVIAPAMGGLVVGQEVARQLNKRFIFAEREDKKLSMRRGFTLDKSEKVLVCEDVVITGAAHNCIELPTSACICLIPGRRAVRLREPGSARRTSMNNTNDNRLSVKELAGRIGVSTDTIRRAFRKGEIPALRVRTALRFDLDDVLRSMQRNAEARFGTKACAADGSRRPRAGTPSPRTGNDGGANHRDHSRRSTESMSVPFPLTIDWLAFTLPSCSLQDTLQVLGGDWIRGESGFRRYPVSWITTGSDRGIGKLGTGAARNPLEVHVDLSAGIVAPWEAGKENCEYFIIPLTVIVMIRYSARYKHSKPPQFLIDDGKREM